MTGCVGFLSDAVESRGNLGGAIMAEIYNDVFDELDAPIGHVHTDEHPIPYGHFMEEAMLPTADKIIAAVKKVCYVE